MTVVSVRNTIDHGAEVIRAEAAALTMLAGVLDTDFSAAVDLLVGARGRIILAGMGKSGHIARKIAATLSATGCAAYYLHPGEASHGDLGMMRSGDVLLILSNSGETPEVVAVLTHAQRLAIPVIAMTAGAKSMLARNASITLVLPDCGEACPEGVAPTTSTTMMLALGDALAVAAMRKRGTSRTDLAHWHPGGRIGWGLQTLEALVRRTEPLPLVRAETCARDVVLEMTSCGKGVAGVVDMHGDLIGVITDGDLRRAFDHMLLAVAGELMTRDPVTITKDATVDEAVARMQENKITVLFVMERSGSRRPWGLLHIHDLRLGA
ncbi:KpsF/GutQ family sugar-phosphate isomerase [Sphingomonas sp. TDK1]|uniref:KpsF/GutQ family sugar-phosphate isomerase n=1 Tax=Sphingomonas sp. TDK1 TaxID=453247 RepID=UPI0007D91906|nr:KpsF/GutQ family sugar-phosphate isomerase [Sphingomonas sp. TDK1]OAN66262.1 D-arabinose 5-phosphate [Sphingomonas sp. TDK1]